jgi:hypothetical protein
MARNEADRYLPSALTAWGLFASAVVVYDDGSTDGTAELAEAAGAAVVRAPRDAAPGWGEEWRKRSALWDAAVAQGTEWIFVLDADMVPASDPSVLWTAPVDAIAWRLFDMWSPHQYREDGLWQAHHHPRVWAVRPEAVIGQPEWNQRSVHCGHFPSNLHANGLVLAPPEMSILHYGYADARDRAQKLTQYESVARELTAPELVHALSIGAEARCLALPIQARWPLLRAS